MFEVTRTWIGAAAEAHIAAAAIDLGIQVLRPSVEGCRYDLAFDFGDRIDRVQCKSGRLDGDVVMVRTSTSRHTPSGYVSTTYCREEVDAVAIWCAELQRCYYLPIDHVAGKTYLHLRLSPARNNQRIGVTMAADHELGAIAQLGERLAGSQKVAGSSPAGST